MQENPFANQKEKLPTEQEKNVQEVFKLNPELAKIGTEKEYANYLEGIFPESKVKNVLYHSTKASFEKFDKDFISRGNVAFGEGFYFSDQSRSHKDYKGSDKTLAVVVDLKNTFTDSDDERRLREEPKFNPYVTSHEKLLEVKKNHNDFLEKNYDGVIATYNNKNEFVIFDPEKIHILGSKSDIENFKEFVSKSKSS